MILETLRSAITRLFPELSDSEFSLLTAGWDCVAVDVGGRLIFKFPRHEAAEKALVTEASLLDVIRPAVTMPVPDLTLYPGPPLFSRHIKLQVSISSPHSMNVCRSKPASAWQPIRRSSSPSFTASMRAR